MAERLARTLMLQGTSSSVGKSYLAAGLCRLYARRGLRVAPFKAQNMALNSAVTVGGAEIGRAQAVQAEAAGVLAEAAMNPLLPASDRRRVRGLVVNRFRGDPRLFEDGIDFLERRSRLPVLGVVPHLAVRLPAEDSLNLDHLETETGSAILDVAVLLLNRISNFDELEALAVEPGVRLRLVEGPEQLGRPDLAVLPGSKTTVADLARLRESGLAEAVLEARAAGSALLGICGGYQVRGGEIRDPHGAQGS